MATIALILSIVGSLNWGLVGLFQFDLVAWLFGGQDNIVSRIIYALVGLAGPWISGGIEFNYPQHHRPAHKYRKSRSDHAKTVQLLLRLHRS